MYGKVNEYGKVPDFDQFKIVDENWFFYSALNQLFAFNTKSQKQYLLPIGEKTFKSFNCEAQILSIFTTEGITNYKITLP